MESHLRRNKYSHSLTLPVLKPPNVHNPPSPPVCPVELTLSNFNDYELGNNKVWYSTPLFTHLNGYGLSLKACVCSRGDGGGKYVNLNLLVMKGSYDETLHWPLKGSFQVALLRCGSEEGHHTETIEFKNTTLQECSLGLRVTETEKAKKGIRDPQFHSFNSTQR